LTGRSAFLISTAFDELLLFGRLGYGGGYGIAFFFLRATFGGDNRKLRCRFHLVAVLSQKVLWHFHLPAGGWAE
jgi:hypothetical protein